MFFRLPPVFHRFRRFGNSVDDFAQISVIPPYPTSSRVPATFSRRPPVFTRFHRFPRFGHSVDAFAQISVIPTVSYV